jgi:hypothetical protein
VRGIILVLVAIMLALLIAAVNAAQPGIVIPEGKTEFGPIRINSLHRFGNLGFDRATSFSDPNVVAKATISWSFDDGKTYPFQCGIMFRGGPDANGQIIPASSILCQLPDELPPPTHIKGVVVVTGGSIALTKSPGLGSR